MEIISHPEVLVKFENYPERVKFKLWYLRELIIDTAQTIDSITRIEETLKWGQPSYLVKGGSTIRMDWKAKNPDQYAMYFKCTTPIVSSIKKIFGDEFNYEKNRALVFDMNDKIPKNKITQCIRLGLEYHRLKKIPDLGLSQL